MADLLEILQGAQELNDVMQDLVERQGQTDDEEWQAFYNAQIATCRTAQNQIYDEAKAWSDERTASQVVTDLATVASTVRTANHLRRTTRDRNRRADASSIMRIAGWARTYLEARQQELASEAGAVGGSVNGEDSQSGTSRRRHRSRR